MTGQNSTVRVGLIGCGSMGRLHAGYLGGEEISGARLAAICDRHAENLDAVEAMARHPVERFTDADAFFKSAKLDAVLISTPHFSHAPLAIQAFANGLHVLIEKPAGAHTQQVREMNDAAARSGRVFSIMFNRRCRPAHAQLKAFIDSGELGPIKRTVWLTTRWYRSQSYFDSCSWRATWKGEGGGVLLNQAIHQLDLWQWVCGMPERLRAFCHFGKHHDIEVEDDVTAYLEYPGGATGVLVCSTGDTPGTERLEIVGDRGKVVMEEDRITFWRTRVSERAFNAQHKAGFGEPETWRCEIPVNGTAEDHKTITANWVKAIRGEASLLIPGAEGLKSLQLSNAMLLSTWRDDWVSIPFDDALYLSELEQRIRNSRGKKGVASQRQTMDVRQSFHVS